MTEHGKVSVFAAMDMIRHAVPLLDQETVPTGEASGRVLAEPIESRRDVPGFRASAMDGHACRIAELSAGARPRVIAGGAAGRWPSPLPMMHASAISTGAPVPEGADWVVPKEHAELLDGRLLPRLGLLRNSNIREIGEDFRAGTIIAEAGTWVGPDVIAAAAAGGYHQLPVRRLPRTALLTTGSELVSDGTPAATIDSNGPMIAAHLRLLGMPPAFQATIPDDADALDRALERSARFDLMVSTGGVSAGDHDLVRQAVERAGGRVCFHGVAMRPGKPILFAILPDDTLFFGLPGNPVAAMVGLRFFVTAALRAMLGLAEECGEIVEALHPGRAGTTLFLRGRRTRTDLGEWTIDLDLDQRSHILSSVLSADCWLRVADRAGTFEHRVFGKLPSLQAH